LKLRRCSKVGNEPSGKPFDDLSIDQNGKAYNPMVNAGAIITASMAPGRNDRARYDFFEAAVRQMANKVERCKLPGTQNPF
jgi:glutaminase